MDGKEKQSCKIGIAKTYTDTTNNDSYSSVAAGGRCKVPNCGCPRFRNMGPNYPESELCRCDHWEWEH